MKILNLFFTSAIVCLIFSCSDACDDLNCGENGICDDGSCLCDTGYEGDNCDTKVIDKFLGAWISNDWECLDGNGSSVPFTLVFELGNDGMDLKLSDPNIPNIVFDIDYNSTSFKILEKEVLFYILTGNGTFNPSGTINLNYNITEEEHVNTCTGLFVKQ